MQVQTQGLDTFNQVEIESTKLDLLGSLHTPCSTKLCQN